MAEITVLEESVDEAKIELKLNASSFIVHNFYAMNCSWSFLARDGKMYISLDENYLEAGSPFPVKLHYELSGGLTAVGALVFHRAGSWSTSSQTAKLFDNCGSFENVSCTVVLQLYEKWAMQKAISCQSAIDFELAAIREENAKLRREMTQLKEARSSLVADDCAQSNPANQDQDPDDRSSVISIESLSPSSTESDETPYWARQMAAQISALTAAVTENSLSMGNNSKA